MQQKAQNPKGIATPVDNWDDDVEVSLGKNMNSRAQTRSFMT